MNWVSALQLLLDHDRVVQDLKPQTPQTPGGLDERESTDKAGGMTYQAIGRENPRKLT